MRKRILSLLLVFVMVLGMVPMGASADEVSSVDVFVSLSRDAEYMAGKETGIPLVLQPVTIPYFDLALYGLEEYYFSSESYGDDGDGMPGSVLKPGTAETAYGKVTMLHVNIYITEVYYCGLDPAEAGKGYLYQNGHLASGNYTFDYENCLLFISGGVGSSFLNRFWDYDCNLNYYVNYEYPLASSGWGATCDQILAKDGDILSLGSFSSWNFLNDSEYGFNYIQAETDTVTQGETIELSVLRAGENLWNPGDYGSTVHTPLSSCPEVFYCPVTDMPGGDVTAWNSLGYADDNGMITLDTTDMAPGTYIIAIPGQYGCEYSDEIVSTPGGMRLTVEAAESEDDVAVDTSKLNGTLPEENISFSGDTMTIAPAENTPACVVLVKNGDTYTRVAATKNGDKYDFDVSALPEGASVVVAVKGDANCDGVVNVSDYTAIARSLLQTNSGRYQALEELNFNVGDANGDGSINVSDYTAIARSLLQTGNGRYAAISW